MEKAKIWNTWPAKKLTNAKATRILKTADPTIVPGPTSPYPIINKPNYKKLFTSKLAHGNTTLHS